MSTTKSINVDERKSGNVLRFLKPPTSRRIVGSILQNRRVAPSICGRALWAPSPSPARSRYAPSHWTDELAKEVSRCADWADHDGPSVLNFDGRQLFRFTPTLVYKSIGVAAAVTETQRSEAAACSIAALLVPKTFALIVERSADFVVIRTLVQLAQDWLGLPIDQIAELEVIARHRIYI